MTVTINGTTGVAGVDGTAATPAIQGNDTNTGIFFPAADTIAFAEGGAEVARFNSSGTLSTSFDASINGVTVGRGNSSVSTNTAVGNQSLVANTTGFSNTAVGANALDSCTGGYRNTAIGAAALASITTGYTNTAVGEEAGFSSSTGTDSLFLGIGSGYNATSGSGNIVIHDLAKSNFSVFNVTSQSDRVVMGHTFISNAYIKVAWTVTSDARDKTNISDIPHGLAFVQQLQPKQYQFKKSRTDETPHGKNRYGFLAQDILALEGDSPVIIDNEDADHLKYQGESLVPVLVKAIQEQQAIITDLKARIETLENK